MRILNKYTDEVAAEVPETDLDAVKSALSKGTEAAEQMRKLHKRELSQALLHFSDELKNRSEEFASLITTETGKGIRYSRIEVESASDYFRTAAEYQHDSIGEVEATDFGSMDAGDISFSLQSPIGLVYAITPFSEPLGSVSRDVALALKSGNAIIIKPSTIAPLSSMKLRELAENSGLPENSVQVVIAPGGGKVSDYLLESEEVGMVSFSGRIESAHEVSRRTGLKKTFMTIGNNSSVVVWDDSDLDMAAESVSEAAFGSQGQVLYRPFRIIVNSNSYEYFRNRVIGIASSLKQGDPMEEDTDIGPLADKTSFQELDSLVSDLLNGGAELAYGGKVDDRFFGPTILEDTNGVHQPVKQELFGPVIMLEKVDSFEDAVRIANETSKWGQVGFFTADMNLAFAAIDRLRHATVLLNSSPPYSAVNSAPFFTAAGIGNNADSANALKKMSRQKVAIIKR